MGTLMQHAILLSFLLSLQSIAGDYEAFEARQRGDIEAALEAVQSDQWRGVLEYERQNYDAARESFNVQTEFGAYNRATATAMSGDIDAAISEYQQLLATNPGHAEAAYNLEVLQQAKEKQQQENSDSQEEAGQSSDAEDDPQPSGEPEEPQESDDESTSKVGERGRSPITPKDNGNEPEKGGESQDQQIPPEPQQAPDLQALDQDQDSPSDAQAESKTSAENFDEQQMDQWLQKLPDPGNELLQLRVRMMHARYYPKIRSWDGQAW